ncbi:hypothetical protein HPB50_008251 [Hyalomma asiaticum]|uniref:Uncharacterized protein n=1 Tax=Hyalomma asiaticum TaxID=266040 RepID=A0ACB7TCK5_HYAAI|nr:hypothetical protein HPB50_008251 [Hyalomma asiaticum]
MRPNKHRRSKKDSFSSDSDAAQRPEETTQIVPISATGRLSREEQAARYINIRFVNIYAPVKRADTNAFYKALHPSLLEPIPHVLRGDFNCVLDSQRDIRGPGQGGSTYPLERALQALESRVRDRRVGLSARRPISSYPHIENNSQQNRQGIPDFLVPLLEACTVIALPDYLKKKTDHLPVASIVRGEPRPSGGNRAFGGLTPRY